MIEGNDFVFLENTENLDKTPPKSASFTSLNEEQLREQLKLALDEEAYEKAAMIRDELSKRKTS